MSINYAVTKKVDKSKGIAKERYYATTRALQKTRKQCTNC